MFGPESCDLDVVAAGDGPATSVRPIKPSTATRLAAPLGRLCIGSILSVTLHVPIGLDTFSGQVRRALVTTYRGTAILAVFFMGWKPMPRKTSHSPSPTLISIPVANNYTARQRCCEKIAAAFSTSYLEQGQPCSTR
jgi:hypothetical protein